MVVDMNGIATHTTGDVVDIHDRDYFKKAIAGESVVTDPIISKTDGSIVVVFAVPIKEGNTVTGVLVARRDGNELSNYTNEMQYNGREVFMINSEGTTVANNDQKRVQEMFNIFEEYEKNPKIVGIFNLQKKMAEGESGVGEYTFNGEEKYMGYHPVEGTNWSLGISAPKSIVMAKVDNLNLNMTVASTIFLLVGIALTIFIARTISRPIKETTRYLNVIATGDFTTDISEKLLAKHDEIGILANSLDKMQNSIRTMIKAVVGESSIVSEMLTTINKNMHNLNANIGEISSTTQQLSAGTEEMAASSEEMNATSLEVEKSIESIAAKAQEGAVTINSRYV
jgi:methyl-accepting chemotaxis protein